MFVSLILFFFFLLNFFFLCLKMFYLHNSVLSCAIVQHYSNLDKIQNHSLSRNKVTSVNILWRYNQRKAISIFDFFINFSPCETLLNISPPSLKNQFQKWSQEKSYQPCNKSKEANE